jgi:hypothetical protein
MDNPLNDYPSLKQADLSVLSPDATTFVNPRDVTSKALVKLVDTLVDTGLLRRRANNGSHLVYTPTPAGTKLFTQFEEYNSQCVQTPPAT